MTYPILLLASMLAAQTQPVPRSDTIVRQVTGPASPPVATLRTEITIGQENGPPEYILGNFSALTMGKDGSVFIGESSQSTVQVRQYDAAGKYLRTFGRRGQGPGELRSVTDIGIHPDGRVLILDANRGYISVYAANGTFQTEWQLPQIRVFQRHFFVAPDGIIYVPNMVPPTTPPSTSQTLYAFIRLSPEGRVIDTLLPPAPPANMPARRITGQAPNGTARGISIPFAPEHVMTMSRLGYFVTGRTDRNSLELHLPIQSGRGATPWRPGNPITSLVHNVPRTRFPDSERTAMRAQIDRAMLNGSNWNWNGAVMPDYRPSFIILSTSGDGRIFTTGFDPQHTYSAQEFSDFDDEAVHMWNVYEPGGRYLGRIRTEAGTVILAGWGDQVLVVRFGADVPQVSRARIVWPAG